MTLVRLTPLLPMLACSEYTLQPLDDLAVQVDTVVDAPVPATPSWGDTDGPHRTHWYAYDDPTPRETTSSPRHQVDHHGDPSLYWYEPSGARGMIETADVETDFERLRRYTIDGSGGPILLDGPMSFGTNSELDTFEWATFTHVLCEFWVDEGDDPDRWRLTTGEVDDGILVLLNGHYLGHLTLRQRGDWTLPVVPGRTNTIAVLLVDDSADDRYVDEISLTRDGVFVR